MRNQHYHGGNVFGGRGRQNYECTRSVFDWDVVWCGDHVNTRQFGRCSMRGVFFGIEYDNDKIPNAIVIPGTRSGKFVKWRDEYTPTVINRADGSRVLRERRYVQCPAGFRLRKDEILGEMKRNKTEDYQDGKFFVVANHAVRSFPHAVKAKLEEEERKRQDAAKKSAGGNDAPVVGEPGQPETSNPSIRKATVAEATDAGAPEGSAAPSESPRPEHPPS